MEQDDFDVVMKEVKAQRADLERQKEAQFAVPEEALVDAVKKVLGRH